jgi:hypothetical protein
VTDDLGRCPECGDYDDTEVGPCGSCGLVFATCYADHPGDDAGTWLAVNWAGKLVTKADGETCPRCVKAA